ncbi:MAG: PrsW family intramembrane metalloprotease [Methanomassiliicoccales archaeon]|nr:PrsW family intramembrane metalloprotease [Methanomassiliicoccales archaeon]
MAIGTVETVAVVLAAVLPSFLYVLVIRNTELHQREPMSVVFLALLYGGTGAFGIALLLESLTVFGLFTDTSILNRFLWGPGGPSPELELLVLAVVIAPIVEETVKALGVFAFHRKLTEVENGMIYGAAVGLGFAAAENVLYFGDAILTGLEVFLITAILRTLTSTLLHASATAVSGYGIARHRLFRQQGRSAHWVQFVLMAMAIHAAFNLFAIISVILPMGTMEIYVLGLLGSFAIAGIAFRLMRLRIRQLDVSS